MSIELCDNLINFKWHDVAAKYLHSESRTRCIIKGGQGGGTAASMNDLAMRFLKIHPIEWRNRINKPVRCVSKVKPQDKDDEENQQLVEFRRFIPADLIKKDITARSNIITLRDPKGGPDNKVEFMGSTQELDAFMSVQRQALYQDEEIDRVKWDECHVRLLRENGDTNISLTPVRGMDWTFDRLWKRARHIYRSQVICDKFGYPRVENFEGMPDIEVFCWATDDNPVMTIEAIDRLFSDIDDQDELAMRRYGVFRQVSGRIYKSFDRAIHVVPYEDVFDEDTFKGYWHFRVIDYHPSKPWNVSWVAVTPTHEWFVWREFLARHDNVVCQDLRERIKELSLLDEDEEFNRATLIDPLSRVKQANTGMTVFEDLSIGDYGLRRLTPADTKNEQGRMHIKMRLKNSLICGVPGNNIDRQFPEDLRYGNYRPTIWFMDVCKGHVEHFQNFRKVEFKQEHVKATRTVTRDSEKWSDYCRNLEFLGALSPVWYQAEEESYWQHQRVFQGRR